MASMESLFLSNRDTWWTTKLKDSRPLPRVDDFIGTSGLFAAFLSFTSAR